MPVLQTIQADRGQGLHADVLNVLIVPHHGSALRRRCSTERGVRSCRWVS